MPKQLRPLVAEFVGTLLFVFLGAGSVVALVAAGTTPTSIGSLGVALAHGVAMAIIVSMTMSISGGHMNPGVTPGGGMGRAAAAWQGRARGVCWSGPLTGAGGGGALGKAVWLPRKQ